MYLTSVEDSIAGGPERLDYGAGFIQWQIQVVDGRNKTPFYRHPHSNISPDHPTYWATPDESDEVWDDCDSYRLSWDFVDDFPRPTEFYASPSFMGAPNQANFPVPKFVLRIASWVAPTLARANQTPANPTPAKSVSLNTTSTRSSRAGWATATYTTKASRLLSWRPIRRKLKLLPRSEPAPVVTTGNTA